MELSSVFHFRGWTIKYGLSMEKQSSPSSVRTIAFVHGTPWDSTVYLPITRALLSKVNHRILRYDLPGYGESQGFTPDSDAEKQKFPGDTSVAFQALALIELLKSLDLDKAPDLHLVAHDIAGAVVLRSHLLHGLDFASLLLMDTNAVLPWGDGFYKLARSAPDTFLQLPSNIYEAVVRAVIKSATFNPGTLASGWEDTLAKPWIAASGDTLTMVQAKQASFVRQIAQANDQDVAEMLDQNLYSKMRCPAVKIMWGEQDQWIPREKMERLAGMLGSCLKEFVVVPEAGHLLMIDQPERVALEIFQWLDRR